MISAIRSEAERLGYAFFSGPPVAVAGRISSFPAAWLSTVKLLARQGRGEQKETYRIAMYLLGKAPVGGAEEAWAKHERDAASICDSLTSGDGVVRTFNMKCTPNTKSFTNSGETGLAVEFDVETYKCG